MQHIIKIAGKAKALAAMPGLRSIRFFVASAIVSGMAVAVAGCSIHPVQKDVTQVPSQDIVTHIRCEARHAIFQKSVRQLEYGSKKQNILGRPDIAAKFDTVTNDLRLQYKNPDGLLRFKPDQLPNLESKLFYKRYIATVIAYDFLMQGIEVNSTALAADPLRLISGGTAGIVVGASSSLTRDNARHFKTSDTFKDLLEIPNRQCPRNGPPENFVYPISGQVGLEEVIDTFIDLNENDPLDTFGKDDKQVFADTLKFTTIFSGGLTPHVEIAASGTKIGSGSPTNVNFQQAAPMCIRCPSALPWERPRPFHRSGSRFRALLLQAGDRSPTKRRRFKLSTSFASEHSWIAPVRQFFDST